MDVAIISDTAFERVGYKDENGKTVLCCDTYAVEKGYCTNPGHLLLPSDLKEDYVTRVLSLKNSKNSGTLVYDVKKTGIYYLVSISCDYRAGLVRFSGDFEAVNPHGQLPATQYGLFPFTGFMLLCFVLMTAFWLNVCSKYATEVLSVHVIILVVAVLFVLDMLARFLHLAVFNYTGRPVFFFSLLAIVIDCSTRTLTRILMLFICMGLGVTRSTLDDSLVSLKLVVVAVAYYLVSFGDAYLNIYSSQEPLVETLRFVFTSLIDAIFYFWIFVSLMGTMDELSERKQEKKLELFVRLRNLMITAVLVATVTLLCFAQVVIFDLSAKMWRLQWLMNQGVWDLFYLLFLGAIMVMWLPSENAAEYASHIQIATNDQEEAMPVESLVDVENEGSHIVEEVTSPMKPMDVVEIQE